MSDETIMQFARRFLNDPEYKESLVIRLREGKAGSRVKNMLLTYARGPEPAGEYARSILTAAGISWGFQQQEHIQSSADVGLIEDMGVPPGRGRL